MFGQEISRNREVIYQPTFASQCESRKIITSPVAASAPLRRARINPPRSLERTILTTPSGQVAWTYLSNFSFNSSESDNNKFISSFYIINTKLHVWEHIPHSTQINPPILPALHPTTCTYH